MPVTFNFANSTFIYKFQYKNKLRLRNDSVRAALGDFSKFRFYLFAGRREQGRIHFKLSNELGVFLDLFYSQDIFYLFNLNVSHWRSPKLCKILVIRLKKLIYFHKQCNTGRNKVDWCW